MEMNRNDKLPAELYAAALKAVLPYEAVKDCCKNITSLYETGNFRRLIVVGFGKAACQMAKAFEDNMPVPVDKGIVITKYGHCSEKLKKIHVYEAGHPLPDNNGLKGTEDIVKFLKGADENTLIVCLISGGGSALLVCPSEGISLSEKRQITELLLRAGADINGLNTVRKHLSQVKGGRLAEIAYPATIVSLILSDVIGDRLDVIASGPTVPDGSTYREAIDVLEKYSLLDKIPGNVLDILYKGYRGLIPETPKADNGIFRNAENIIIGSNRKALDAAKKKAEEYKLNTEIISSEITGEARDAGKWLAKEATEARNTSGICNKRRICLISGGETTVTVKGTGMGGRNMELALSFAIEIEGIEGITLLSAGTDGTDGPTDAAGAIVNGKTVSEARKKGFDPSEYLLNNDSYNFFKSIGGLYITGPTGTNVMDIQLVLIE